MAKGKKIDYSTYLLAAGSGVAGAVIGSQLTNGVEKAMVKGNVKNAYRLAPLVTTGLGLAVVLLAPNPVKGVGLGMVSVAGAETVEGLLEGKSNTDLPTDDATTVADFSAVDSATERINSATERVNSNDSYIEFMDF